MFFLISILILIWLYSLRFKHLHIFSEEVGQPTLVQKQLRNKKIARKRIVFYVFILFLCLLALFK